MNQIVAKEFLEAWKCLEGVISLSGKNRGRKATTEEAEFLIKALIEVHHKSHKLGLRQSVILCDRLYYQLADKGHHRIWKLENMRASYTMPKEVPLPDFETVYWQAQGIAEEIRSGLETVRLAVIVSDKAQFFERDDLFGHEFHSKASNAINTEAKLAGNCLAAELNTAAVFHLMRIAEHGLHALANYLLPNQSNKPYPLEFSEWGKVIEPIGAALVKGHAKVLNGMTAGAAKDLELKFYSGLLHDLNYFKDAYRNPVSHLRGTYSEREALVVHDKVKEFMLRVAIKVPLV